SIKFVFDYQMRDESTWPSAVWTSDVYSGVSVIDNGKTLGSGDWALIKLDRPVPDRRPLPIRLSGQAPNGTSLAVLGYPKGIPEKYDDGARILNGNTTTFTSNLDTFSANSGSPVFDKVTGTVEGVLDSGESDFESNGFCNELKGCPD